MVAAMVQGQDDYEDYDAVPYKGGYDQEAAYGSLRTADEECGYQRTEFGERDDEREGGYGNERCPYGKVPGPSVYGGVPTLGGVYGGGRDRTRPSSDGARPDEGIQANCGPWRPAYGEEEGSGHTNPSYDEQEEEYRKSRPSHRKEETTYQQSAYQRSSYGEESGYRNPTPVYWEEGLGYMRSGYGEEEFDYRKPRPAYGEEESEYRHSQYRKEEATAEVGYGGYGRRQQYGEESGHGGRYRYDDAGESARYAGGSRYTELQPAEEDTSRRFWW